jgi:uncharacterized protein
LIEFYGVQTKAWALFALLFGAGFAILMRRAEAAGKSITPLVVRRLLGLAIIGVAVEAISGFTILLDYAVWGLPLLIVRKWPTRWLLILAIASALAANVYSVARSSIDVVTLGRAGAASAAMNRTHASSETAAGITAESEATSFPIAVTAQVAKMRLRWSNPRSYLPSANLVLFILGLLAVRHGIFDEPKRHLQIIAAAMTFGFVSWLIGWWLQVNVPADLTYKGVPIPGARFGFGLVSEQWLAFTYAGAALLLLTYKPVWNKTLGLVAAAGRMTLTNYTVHAFLIAWLAPSYGLGLRLRPYGVLAATLSFFIVLAFMSREWLSRFEYGPLEWLWRIVTYARWLPISRPRQVAASVIA